MRACEGIQADENGNHFSVLMPDGLARTVLVGHLKNMALVSSRGRVWLAMAANFGFIPDIRFFASSKRRNPFLLWCSR
jgi:hypothetical protein